jgi:hypothetical protein
MAHEIEIWKDAPEEHDFPAAEDYLGLIFTEEQSASLVKALRKASVIRQKAKVSCAPAAWPCSPRKTHMWRAI